MEEREGGSDGGVEREGVSFGENLNHIMWLRFSVEGLLSSTSSNQSNDFYLIKKFEVQA